MGEERYECPECGKHFGSEEIFREHARIEHSRPVEAVEQKVVDVRELFTKLRPSINRSFVAGLALGLIVAGAAFSGYTYWRSLDHRTKVPVTVVTCDNCSYQKFQTATDRMFNAKYSEVGYQGEKGQQLIDRYRINYVPAFIFDRQKLEQAEDFHKVKPVLVEFSDAYVIPDRGNQVAQRLSSGKELE